MPSGLTKLIYQPDTQSTEEFTIIINAAAYKKWKDGDTTIPLADVVDSFKVFHSAQGSQGLLGQASNQQLDTVFGTHKDVDVIEFILKNGKEQKSDLAPNDGTNVNPTRGSSQKDSR